MMAVLRCSVCKVFYHPSTLKDGVCPVCQKAQERESERLLNMAGQLGQ